MEPVIRPAFEQILHPTDFTSQNEVAFAHALRLAVAARATLDVIHVDRDAHVVEWSQFPDAETTLRRWSLDDSGFEVNKISAYGTEPVQPLLDYLDERPADLIVLATHQRDGIDRWLHREIAQKLARLRALTTLFVPFGVEGFVSLDHGALSLRKVLVPVDWTPAPQAAITTAAALVSLLGCANVDWTLLHVGENGAAVPDVRPPETAGWQWHEQTRVGNVVEQILRAAEETEPDLIVMTTRGHDGFLDALRGSTTEQVINQAACPLLSVPAWPA